MAFRPMAVDGIMPKQMPKASTQKVKELARRLGKGERTIWRWVSEGCDLESERSIRAFAEGKELRKSNIQKGRERRAALNGSNGSGAHTPERPVLDRLLSGDLPAPGARGAAAALQRLEQAEERAYARLLQAMDRGTPFQIQELQDFWLKCSEALRRFDLAVEIARRDSEEQVPKKLAEELSLYIAEWLRIAFMQFLSSEGPTLIGIKQFGEWKKYAIERFGGILDLTVKTSLSTNSPIPEWAAARVREAWNVAVTS